MITKKTLRALDAFEVSPGHREAFALVEGFMSGDKLDGSHFRRHSSMLKEVPAVVHKQKVGWSKE